MASYKSFARVAWGYLLFSIGIAFAAPHINLGNASEAMFFIPTVNTLVKHSLTQLKITNYFVLMLVALPVVVLLMIITHPTRRAFVVGVSAMRKALSLCFFLFAIVLLSGFAFLLSPDRVYVGTRIRAILSLASHTTLGLGLIYGLILVCLALLLCLTLLALRDIPIRRRSSA